MTIVLVVTVGLSSFIDGQLDGQSGVDGPWEEAVVRQ